MALATYMYLTYPWTGQLYPDLQVYLYPFSSFPCEQAKRASDVCICLIWEKNGDEDATFTVPVGIVLLSLCSAWILLCCHVESLDLGRKCNHGHESTYMVGASPRSRQHVILVRFYGAQYMY